MKKILLSVVCLMMMGIQSVMAQANITAPTLPAELTLSDDMECYLYNVGGELFWDDTYTNSGYSDFAISNYGAKFQIKKVDETLYTLYRMSDNYYITASMGTGRTTSSTSSNIKFNIKTVDGGYTIQRNYNYDESQYMGTTKGSTEICDTITAGGNIVWKLLPATEDTEKYMATAHLYRAILSAAAYNTELYSQHIDVYNNSASTAAEMTASATILDKAIALTAKVATMNWNQGDYQMLLQDDPNQGWQDSYDSYGKYLYGSFSKNKDAYQTLEATVVVDQAVTLCYMVDNDGFSSSSSVSNMRGIVDVYIDDVLVRKINRYELSRGIRFHDEMAVGKHTIKWSFEYDGTSSITYYVKEIATYATPLITVNLPSAGSLGTEVLKQVSNLADVRCLKVVGQLNSYDLGRIDGMTNLFSLDMGEAELSEIPDEQFSRYHRDVNKWDWLHKMVLPKNLKKIGNNAFYQSYIDDIQFPQTVESIGEHAFYNSRIQEAVMPDRMSNMGSEAFYGCRSLTKVHIPAGLATIPSNAFSDSYALAEVEIPEGVVTVQSYAFSECFPMNVRIPSTITTIDSYGFYKCSIDTLVMKNAIDVGNYAFRDNQLKHLVVAEGSALGNYAFADNSLETVELPSTYFSVGYNNVLANNPTLKTLTLKSPTVVNGSKLTSFLEECGTTMTIRVPQYLVTAYKLADYWNTFSATIEGFSTADIDFWQINQALTLNNDRFEGSPNIELSTSGSLEILGDEAMNIQSLTIHHNLDEEAPAKVLSNTSNIVINGSLSNVMYTEANRWYFISLPFNFKVSDIVTGSGGKFAIRYYDGANRATNGASGSWKDFADDAVVYAGTGFIFQTSRDQWITFIATDDADKQNVVRNNEFAKSLDANYAESSANRGWNLVGNPYQCYYNLHKINFTAPITTWLMKSNGSGTYKAYSIIDDDYAIKPNEAFFVQCPDEVNTVTFPIVGRQLTSEITDQNAAPALRAGAIADRKLVELQLASGEMQDETRVVFNEKASLSYEQTCDASKFMSMDSKMPQLYTLDTDATRYAINERPAQDGTVRLGLFIPADGTYTIRVSRNREAGQIWLKDQNNGNVYDITNAEYSFSAEAGTLDQRFMLVAGDVTGIHEITEKTTNDLKAVYDLIGRKMENNRMSRGVYIIRQDGKARKVTVK